MSLLSAAFRAVTMVSAAGWPEQPIAVLVRHDTREFFATLMGYAASAAVGAVKLLRQIGANVVAACFIIDLPEFGGAAKLRAMDVPVRTLMTFEGH
jgi:hypothetical protein